MIKPLYLLLFNNNITKRLLNDDYLPFIMESRITKCDENGLVYYVTNGDLGVVLKRYQEGAQVIDIQGGRIVKAPVGGTYKLTWPSFFRPRDFAEKIIGIFPNSTYGLEIDDNHNGGGFSLKELEGVPKAPNELLSNFQNQRDMQYFRIHLPDLILNWSRDYCPPGKKPTAYYELWAWDRSPDRKHFPQIQHLIGSTAPQNFETDLGNLFLSLEQQLQ